tara:strand:+ start:3424 stop:6219 length:2796 start_codon:yes stop_codon:yes gene_type:complete
MSIQLSVYPQNYDGILNPIAAPQTEFIPNTNIVFPYDMVSSVTTMGNPVILDAFSVNPPSTNGWLSFTTDFDGIPYQVTANNHILLSSGQCQGGTSPFTTSAGAYYALSNLTVGIAYFFTADIIDEYDGTGTITISIWNGNTNITSVDYTNTLGALSLSWTAQSVNDVVVISYVNVNIATCDASKIDNVSVMNALAPPIPPTNFSSGEVICDLYEDEDLPLTLSVDEFKNVAEKVQSYSKAFNLPETKRNKRIFNQLFEITRSDDGIIFNAYRKTKCKLQQDGFTLFEGFLRLLDVSEKLGEVSYNVNLYSETIALADTLKELTIGDIGFNELTHEYNTSNIKKSWFNAGGGTGIPYTNPNTSGFRDDHATLKYPFVNWTNQMPISNGSNGPDGFPYLTGLGQAFRPFVQVKYLVDRIFQDSTFSYTSNFFNTADFEKLYMDFNWGGSREPNINIGQGTGENVATNGNYAATAPAWNTVWQDTETYTAATELGYDSSTQKFTATFDGQIFSGTYNGMFRATPATVGTNNQYMGIIKAQVSDVLGNDIGGGGYEDIYTWNNFASWFDYTVSFPFNVTLQTGQSIRFVFQKSTDCASLWQFYTNHPSVPWTVNMTTTITTGTASTSSASLKLRGELGQWEFLKGLITMFNLVTSPDENNPENILIEPYSDVFINNPNSVQHNWSDKVDATEMKLTPLTDLNAKTIFKFVEDEDDFPFRNYKTQVNQHLYGSKKYNAGPSFNILEGEDEIIAEPFAATIVKPLMAQFGAFNVPAIYNYNPSDGLSEAFDNAPRIMYNNEIKDSGITYRIPAQNGGAVEDQNYYLQFSHLTDVPTIVSVPPDPTTDTKDFHFGECQLLVGNATTYNLFNLYWLPYYKELYNPNTRTMTIKVNLTPADINTFKFSDTVIIKNREFRVNKIDYKPNDLAKVEFILIP